MKWWKVEWVSMWTLLTVVACSTTGPFAMTSTRVVPKPGYGAIVGAFENLQSRWAESTVYVYLAPFYQQGAADQGVYMLEPALDAHTTVEHNGTFLATDIKPGRYVIIVGPDPGQSLPILEGEKAKIFEVRADEVIDLGRIVLDSGAKPKTLSLSRSQSLPRPVTARR